jgi:hypothetical protein
MLGKPVRAVAAADAPRRQRGDGDGAGEHGADPI